MKANEALIGWTPGGDVKVGPLLRQFDIDWTEPFKLTGGAAYVAVRELTGDASIARLFIDFHTIVVRDGVDPTCAHEAFLIIDEYRRRISPDIEGAE